MLVDANLLLFAVDAASPWHERAAGWLTKALNGPGRVGMPWVSLGAFLRISTHPRASHHPLSSEAAWGHVTEWLSAAPTWIPGPTERHADVLGQLLARYHLAGNMVTDAQVATLAIEHGLTVCSADTDFARFAEVRWENPLAS